MSYTDEYLEFWGDLYVSGRLNEEGVDFEAFLANPWRHLQRLGRGRDVDSVRAGFRPLLPAQAEIARLVDAAKPGEVIRLPGKPRRRVA
jgi:hypothetical protein